MIRNVKAITASSYLSMFFLGVAVSLIGAAARNIGLSPSQIGLLVTAQQAGFMISVSIAGALADTYEKPRILFVGSLILAFAFLSFYQIPSFWINLGIMLSIGLGIGTYEGVTDAMLLDLHTERQTLHINVNHFFVTLGSAIITAYLIFLQMNWRSSVIQSGIIVMGLATFFGLTRLEINRDEVEPYIERLRILTQDRLVVGLFLATTLAVGTEIGTTGILTTYLMELRGFTQVTSKLGLVVFLSGVATGRAFIGFYSREKQLAQHILTLFGLSVLCFSGLYLLDLGEFTYVPIFLAGTAMSAVLPLMITLSGLLYEDMAGTVIGALKVAIPLGGMVIPFLLSTVAKYTSLQVSLLVFPAALLVAFLILSLEIRNVRSSDAIPAAEATE